MSGLFGKTPKPADPVRMPVEGDTATKAAEERQRRAIAQRSGRSSTKLSQRSGEAGTSSYSNTLLGSAG